MRNVQNLPLNKIKPDPDQPRKVFDSDHIKGLAENFKIEGVINPIEIDENFVIITGECRWRAAKQAGWKEVPVIINAQKFSEYERFRRQMAENLHQSTAGGSAPMNAVDVARAYKKMIKMKTKKDCKPGLQSREEIYGLIKPIVEDLGISRQTIYEYLRLLDEPQYVLEDIKKGKPRTFYREIDKAPEKYQDTLKRAVSEKKITRRDDLVRFARLARTKPERAEIEILRLTQKQSEDANRILNRAVELGLALKKANPDKFSIEDKKMVLLQLGSVSGTIRNFLGKLNKQNNNIKIEAEVVEQK